MHLDAIANPAEIAGATACPCSHTQSKTASASLLPTELPLGNQDLTDACSQADKANYVALSRFTVAEMTNEVKQAFQQRPHLVDAATGFIRMDVISPFDAPNEIWLITYWKDETSYRTWHRSHLYQESHKGIPKGLKLVPKSVSIRFFEYVAS